MPEETLIDQLIRELEGKNLDEVKKIAREEQERLNKEEERLKLIESGKIPLTIPEELKPISAEEMREILEGAEQAILIAQIVGNWRKRADLAERAKKLREEKLVEAAIAYLTVPKESPTGPRSQPTPKKRRNQLSRPGWIKVDETCANCGTRVTSLPFQPGPNELVYCPLCWMELKAEERRKAATKPKTKTTRSSQKTT